MMMMRGKSVVLQLTAIMLLLTMMAMIIESWWWVSNTVIFIIRTSTTLYGFVTADITIAIVIYCSCYFCSSYYCSHFNYYCTLLLFLWSLRLFMQVCIRVSLHIYTVRNVTKWDCCGFAELWALQHAGFACRCGYKQLRSFSEHVSYKCILCAFCPTGVCRSLVVSEYSYPWLCQYGPPTPKP